MWKHFWCLVSPVCVDSQGRRRPRLGLVPAAVAPSWSLLSPMRGEAVPCPVAPGQPSGITHAPCGGEGAGGHHWRTAADPDVKRIHSGPSVVSILDVWLRNEPVAPFIHLFFNLDFIEILLCGQCSGWVKRFHLGWSHWVLAVPPARCETGGLFLSRFRMERGGGC